MACFGSMSVSRLKTHTLHLRRQVGAPEETRLNDSDKVYMSCSYDVGTFVSCPYRVSGQVVHVVEELCFVL